MRASIDTDVVIHLYLSDRQGLFYDVFDEVTSKSMPQRPMKFRSRMLRTVRRFSYRNGTQRDYEWINAYCKRNNIHYKNKMIVLKEYLSQIE